MAQPTDTRVDIRGCGLRLLRGGAGAPLIFLHGAGGLEGWLPFLDRLSARFDVIAPDHPGFGKSDTPEWLDTVSDLAVFYQDVLDALDLDGAHLVGSSMGGWLAADLASRCTRRLATLTLVDAAGIKVPGVAMGDIYLWPPQELFRNLYHDQALADQRLAHQPTEEELDVILKNRLMAARLGWEPRLHDPHLHKRLHRIDVPTLVLWGDDDRIIPPAYADAYAKLIPGARKVVIPDCGHVPQTEKPEAFIAALEGFLAEAAA